MLLATAVAINQRSYFVADRTYERRRPPLRGGALAALQSQHVVSLHHKMRPGGPGLLSVDFRGWCAARGRLIRGVHALKIGYARAI
jgi:hypothetical protein